MDTSALLLALQQRRSFGLKQVDPSRPVPRAALELLLEAASWAPSHGTTEPWRFSVYQGGALPALSAAFGAAYRAITSAPTAQGEQQQRTKVLMAPVWIALGLEPSGQFPEWEEIAAVACAVQNAHLMASSLGLAAKWTSSAVAISATLAAWVGVPRLLGFLYVGHPALPWPTSTRRPIADTVTWHE